MTAPAEDPRGGEADRYWVLSPCGCVVATPFEIAGHECPPAAGRGDTDGGGEREHSKVPGSETSENGYIGACWCQGRGDAWPCPSTARPAGDRAQSTEGLREEIARAVWFQTGTAGERAADAVLALREVAALLDAQAADRAKVERVEALCEHWGGSYSPNWLAAHFALRRALGGTT